MVYLTGRALELSPLGAAAAATSLAVAHTFWMHAVRAEVYTLFTALMGLELWLWAQWKRGRPWPMRLAVALFGVVLLGHQMALLLLPALVYLLWVRRDWLRWRETVLLAGLLLAGLAPFGVVIQRQIGAPSLVGSLSLYFTHAGIDFSPAMFDFSLALLPRDLGLWLGFLGLQFVGPAGILALWAVPHVWRLSPLWRILAILYVTGVLFAFSYRVNDQYVFYLPSYVAFALAVGLGWEMAARRWGRAARLALLAALAVTSPLAYYGLSAGFARWGANPLGIRQLPGREPNTYFLWPAKNGYTGAADYGRQALSDLPEGSYMVADHTPYETLLYLQVVEGLREDVTLIKIEPGDDLAPLLGSLPPGAPAFIADADPRYYNLSRIEGVELRRVGVVYQVR
jgi:hypothetical protein